MSLMLSDKRKKIKYGHLPPKEAEAEPWDKMCIDLIGPCKIRRKGKLDSTHSAMTMMDLATSWFQLHQISNMISDTMANKAEQEWFHRHP